MKDITLAAPFERHATQSNSARRVLMAGAVGQFVEFYDFAIYGFSVIIIAKLFFPNTDPVAGILAAFAIYGVAFLARPLGGVFFGTMGDRLGRRTVLYITLLAIGVSTAVIGLLPTHETIGIFAPVLLLLCRLAQGFSAGGESVGAPSFVLEHAPTNRRGLWVCITIASSAVPVVVAGVFILGLTNIMSAAEYETWGWRIPFVVAIPFSIIGLYIRSKTEESESFKEVKAQTGEHQKNTLRAIFKNNRKQMLQVFFVVALNALTYFFMSGYLVTYMQTVAKLPQNYALFSNAIGLLTFAILLPLGGRLSDSVGRKPMLLAGSVLIASFAIPVFSLINAHGLTGAIVAQMLLAACLAVYGGGSYAFFVERFPTAVRFTGAAIAYNLSYTVFGGTGPLVGTYLVKVTGDVTAPGYYLATLAVLVFFAAWTVPETAGSDLNTDQSKR